jgi:hypothetical protein
LVILKAEDNDLVVQFGYDAAEDDMKATGEDSTNFWVETLMGHIGMYANSSGEASKAKVLLDWFEYKGK